jgi:hypothetical protein
MKACCDYCGKQSELYPVEDTRSGVSVESDYCEKCLLELMEWAREQVATIE